MLRLLPLTTLAIMAACTESTEPLSVSGMTDGGSYHVTVDADEALTAAAPVFIEITVHDHHNDVHLEGATVTLTPWMSSMGHGLMDGDPVVTEVGMGVYEADFQFSMPGAWELQVDVDGGMDVEQAVLNVEVL